MPIITPSTAPVLSTDEKKIKARNQLGGIINACLRRMLNDYSAGMRVVWANADGLTAQDVMDAFGADAAEVVRLAGVLKTAINSASPGTLPDATPATITPNPDGTVTITPNP